MKYGNDQRFQKLKNKVKIDLKTNCWILNHCLDKSTGASRPNYKGTRVFAKRVFYSVLKEVDVADDERIVNRCGNVLCVNPEHHVHVKSIYLGTDYVEPTSEEQIEDMYLDYKSTQEIADEVGVHRMTIDRHLKKKNMFSSMRLSEDEKEEIIEKYKEGLTIVDICNNIGCCRDTVTKVIKNYERINKARRLLGTL